jgi:cobalt-zinc-cadmium efflux system membrane fusion protein
MLTRLKHWTVALASALPPLLVVAVLAVVAYWGHATDWGAKAMKFGVLIGAAEEDDPDDDKPAGPQAHAPTTEVAPGPPDWCDKHGVADSLCTDCHPDLLASKSPLPPAAEPAVRPSHRPQECRTHLELIRFPSLDAVKHAGIVTAPARQQTLTETVTVNGMVEYDPSQTVRIGPRAGGAVWRVFKRLGDGVRAGELMALIDAAEVGKAKAEYLQAAVHLDTRTRARQMLQPGTAPERTIQEADAAVREARTRLFTAQQALLNLGLPLRGDEPTLPDDQLAKRLQFLGIATDIVASLQTDTATANLLPVVAPLGGTVIDRKGENGETIAAQHTLFIVSDVSTVHVHLDVRQEDADRLARGQRVTFRPDGTNYTAAGTVHWIGTDVDETTRLVHVHAECDNPEGRLKANQFGTATITVGTHAKAVVVPAAAVQWEGCSDVVFVRQAEREFRPRKVRLGLRQNGDVEVLVGLKPGEVVATAGSHVLKSYLFRDRLGAAED